MNKHFSKTLLLFLILSFVIGGLSGGIAGIFVNGLGSNNWLSLLTKMTPFKISENQKIVTVEEESAVIQTVSKASPSVVSIVVTKDLSKIYNLTGPNLFPNNDFFDFFSPFGFRFPQNTPQGSQNKGKVEVGGGTGFIISSDGLILTNRHVVSDKEAGYTVITNQGKKYDAKILALDPFIDIAVIKIEAKNLSVLELGDSDSLKIGQTVIAIGNTLSEYPNTVTKGIISGIGRTVTASGQGGSEVIEEAIQTDTAINPGNSGGPLVNLSSQVIGINTAISQSGQLIGFAIPINAAKRAIASVKKYGRIIRPWIGVRYVIITPELAKANNLSVNYGALIIRGSQKKDLAVVPGSPANKAGLEENDIILEINDQKIDQNRGLAKEISKHQPKEEIKLKILSKGKEKTVKIILEEYKND